MLKKKKTLEEKFLVVAPLLISIDKLLGLGIADQNMRQGLHISIRPETPRKIQLSVFF